MIGKSLPSQSITSSAYKSTENMAWRGKTKYKNNSWAWYQCPDRIEDEESSEDVYERDQEYSYFSKFIIHNEFHQLC